MAIWNTEGDLATNQGDRKRKRSELEYSRPLLRKWRTESEQRMYSVKLVEALRRVRRSTQAAAVRPRSRAVREAADRALAVAARGRTKWSRAILSSRNKIKQSRRRLPEAFPSLSRSKLIVATGDGCLSAGKKKSSPDLGSKAAILGRIVPGCQKLSFATLLEEASDYIAALEMQIRSMAALTAILSASGGGSSDAPAT
ncbi:Transcription factor bHLH148 [Apostasia shenzhenica]|uniref:Transcription factor bHLH148 n=1 Tax=Apostasia shenzhenica TaxID=1088818 RepID=A0A2I0AGK6_9ASPA|nr:Transcription factor bHLH148 [Apostasia shenzhenica]